MNWKEKGLLLFLGGLAGMIFAGAVFDDDPDNRSEEDPYDTDDGDYVEE